MSTGTPMDLDWPGVEAGNGAAGTAPAGSGGVNGAPAGKYLTDEEILGIEPFGETTPPPRSVILRGAKNLSSVDASGNAAAQRDSSGTNRPQNDNVVDNASGATTTRAKSENASAENRQAEARPTGEMPIWMQSAAADPQHGAEAQQLWREHQEFRSAFSSPEEARAIKELLPGGVKDVLSLRDATQSVERIDEAIFSGDARAQSEVVAELARTNPAAFRSLFAEAARVLAAGGLGLEAGNQQGPVIPSGARNLSSGFDVGNDNAQRDSSSALRNGPPRNDNVMEAPERAANLSSLQSPTSSLQNFDPAAYAAFERATNDAVARDVRGSISDTLARVLPEGVADGAARRIGEDIFQEIHRALAADRTLSEQVGALLRDPAAAGRARFGGAEQERVASLLAGRARQLVPSIARRVIGEWTSTVLNTARSKASRQAAAASRVDIATPGSSLDSMPLRSRAAGSRVDYASMTDEEILGI